jgi:NADH-ubiquinone oxidoreductase chain 6
MIMMNKFHNENLDLINFTYLVNDNVILNTYNGYIIDFLTLACILTAIFVITTKNPIVSILYLILLFSLISVYLIYVGISFIGISYLLVYVGAVSILFLFILMLINIRISELANETSNSVLLVLVASLSLTFTLNNTLIANNLDLRNNKYIYNVFSGVDSYNVNNIVSDN